MYTCSRRYFVLKVKFRTHTKLSTHEFSRHHNSPEKKDNFLQDRHMLDLLACVLWISPITQLLNCCKQTLAIIKTNMPNVCHASVEPFDYVPALLISDKKRDSRDLYNYYEKRVLRYCAHYVIISVWILQTLIMT